jgi:hypothetical protein
LLKNGGGPTVLVRTELDALPMEEKTGLPYASKAKAVSNGRETLSPTAAATTSTWQPGWRPRGCW